MAVRWSCGLLMLARLAMLRLRQLLLLVLLLLVADGVGLLLLALGAPADRSGATGAPLAR